MTDQARHELAAAINTAAVWLQVREVKASRRDLKEPARASKVKFDKRLSDLMARHFNAQRDSVQRYLDAGGKLPLPDGLIEDASIQADMTRLLIEAAQDGINVAMSEGTGFDDTLTNKQAAEWAARESGKLITKIDADTLAVVRSSIETYISTPGLTLQDAMNLLPFSMGRAELIATTEITRAYAEANQIAGEQLAKEFEGVPVVKIWYTNEDDRVCDICEQFSGKEIDIADDFGEGVSNPPAHPNCRCWTTTSTRIA